MNVCNPLQTVGKIPKGNSSGPPGSEFCSLSLWLIQPSHTRSFCHAPHRPRGQSIPCLSSHGQYVSECRTLRRSTCACSRPSWRCGGQGRKGWHGRKATNLKLSTRLSTLKTSRPCTGRFIPWTSHLTISLFSEGKPIFLFYCPCNC